jgi:uncharacterized protein YeeX (DUF496 family)
MENIEKIKREIKEKIRNNSKYIHPCNKEFQEDTKRLGFEFGHSYVVWMQKNGILTSPSKADNKWENKKGFKNMSDYVKQWQYKNGISSPTEDNEDCAYYF